MSPRPIQKTRSVHTDFLEVDRCSADTHHCQCGAKPTNVLFLTIIMRSIRRRRLLNTFEVKKKTNSPVKILLFGFTRCKRHSNFGFESLLYCFFFFLNKIRFQLFKVSTWGMDTLLPRSMVQWIRRMIDSCQIQFQYFQLHPICSV